MQLGDLFQSLSETPSAELTQQIIIKLSQLSLPAVFGLVLLKTLVTMAFAYALPLLFFVPSMGILQAIQLSLQAFYRHVVPMTVYGLCLFGLFLLSAPLSFIPLIVIMPLISISFFISFQDIFAHLLKDEASETSAQETTDTDSGTFSA